MVSLFLGLLETKCEEIDDYLVKKLSVNADFDYFFIPSMGLSAGLCLIWNVSLTSNHCILYGNQWICLSFDWFLEKVKIILVYAPNEPAQWQILWGELRPLLFFEGSVIVRVISIKF